MSQFDTIFENVKDSDNYEQNGRIMQYVGNVIKNAKKPLPAEETKALRRFTAEEMKKLIEIVPQAENYRKKDAMFFYEDSLLMVFTLAGKDMSDVSEEQVQTIKRLVQLVDGERAFENAVEETFKLTRIEKSDAEKVIKAAKQIKDVYLRGKLYQGANEHKDKIKNFTPEAKEVFAEYIASDIAKLLKKADDPASDEATALEYAADVCKYFLNEEILALLGKMMTLKTNGIRYFALETLLENGKEAPAQAVRGLAEDLAYAEITYSLLNKHGKSGLFPKEYTSPEYLAKSDMVRWLVYPTELNKKPDAIEFLGEVKVKKELFRIFKFKSDSENLSDDLIGEWLIGWSGDGGNTFSNFDKLSDYEKKTAAKTLKNIVKKLIK